MERDLLSAALWVSGRQSLMTCWESQQRQQRVGHPGRKPKREELGAVGTNRLPRATGARSGRKENHFSFRVPVPPHREGGF